MKPTTKFDYHVFLLKVEEMRDAFATLGKALMKDFEPFITIIKKVNETVEKIEKQKKEEDDG